ncbi:nucleoporin Nup186/Nup192/Nup205 [Cladochytrium replicatum]|nr:nucleoporin Nup186/Nup192/Nup205 [Cladochytrium replicatum]
MADANANTSAVMLGKEKGAGSSGSSLSARDGVSVSAAHSNAEKLRDLILAAYSDASPALLASLHSKLLRERSTLLSPLADPPKNPQSRSEILNSNYINIQGVRAQANADFRNKAIFISDFLDINETKAVHILNDALALQSRWDKDPISTAVTVYHLERSNRLDCLVSLLQGATRARHEASRNLFNQHLADLLPTTAPSVPVGGSGGSSSTLLRPSSLGIPFSNGSTSTIQKSGSNEPSTLFDLLFAALASIKHRVASLWDESFVSNLASKLNSNTPELVRAFVETRLQYLAIEAKYLGYLVFLISVRQALPSRILSLLRHAKTLPLSDPSSIYVVGALLGAFWKLSHPGKAQPDGIIPETSETESSSPMLDDILITAINDFLIVTPSTNSEWAAPQLRSLLSFGWSLTLHDESRRREAASGASERTLMDDSERAAASTILQGRCMDFMQTHLVGFLIAHHALVDPATVSPAWSVWVRRASPLEVAQMFDENVPESNGSISRVLGSNIAGQQSSVRYSTGRSAPFRGVFVLAAEKTFGPSAPSDDDIDAEFAADLVLHLEDMMMTLIRSKTKLIKTLKNADEDADRLYMPPPPPSSTFGTGGRRHDSIGAQQSTPLKPAQGASRPFESVMDLLASLYWNRPNAALPYWTTPALRRFLKMVAELRAPNLVPSGFSLIAALATGESCASNAYSFMSGETPLQSEGSASFSSASTFPKNQSSYVTTTTGWRTLFSSLHHYARTLSEQTSLEIQPSETAALCAFLRVLRTVVVYFPPARVMLYENQHTRAIFTLFSLLVCQVPHELKAALFETLAGFCIGPATEIHGQVWNVLEQVQVLPTVSVHGGQAPSAGQQNQLPPQQQQQRQKAGTAQGIASSSEGLLYDLEETEAIKGVYPETLSFLSLLSALLADPTAATTQSILENLGAGYRTPGIAPYIQFVIDRVFLKAFTRNFVEPDEKWRMIALCLEIFDRCVSAFDFTTMSGGISLDGTGRAFDMGIVVGHPGFELYCRILAGSKLTERIFEIASVGVEMLNSSEANGLPSLRVAVRSALRLSHKVLTEQRMFLQVFIPSLLEREGQYVLPTSLTGLDQLLAYHHQTIVAIAMHVNAKDLDIVLLSIRILGMLSQSVVFMSSGGGTWMDEGSGVNRLVSLLEGSDESSRIVYAFSNLLEAEEPESESEAEDPVDVLGSEFDGSRPEDSEVASSGMINKIRLAVLDLLLTNLTSGISAPNLAHFLLGYQGRGGTRLRANSTLQQQQQREIPDPSVPGARLSCLHVVLDLLRRGMNAASEGTALEDGDDVGDVPLFVSHPALAERSYHLIYRLCADAYTTSPTMRYLRIRENFFETQLKAMPVDGGENLAARLATRAWILQTVALELHVTVLGGQRSSTQRLLEMLYVTPMAGVFLGDSEGDDENEGGMYLGMDGRKARKFQQPLTKILEVLNSLDMSGAQIDGAEGLLRGAAAQTGAGRGIFANVPLEYTTESKTRSRIYDLRAIHTHLVTAIRQAESTGVIASAAQRASALRDIRMILHGLFERNAKLEHAYARQQVVQSWCLLVQTTLTRCFNLFPADIREEKLFELVAALMPKINNCVPAPSVVVAESVSTVVLCLFAQLREDKGFQALMRRGERVGGRSESGVDPMHQVAVRGLVDGITASGTTEVVRGNYYAALISYLQYANPDSVMSWDAEGGNGSASGGGTSTVSTASLLTLLQGYGDRIVEVVARDASDGSDVWKTVAFALLDALVGLHGREQFAAGRVNRVVGLLWRRNYLSHFVGMVKREDAILQAIIAEEPESLNQLYIVEAKLSLLLRIAQSRDGAEKLVESKLIDVLTDCQFVDQKPEMDNVSMTDYDTFLPPSIEKYQSLLLPTFELLIAVSSQLARTNAVVLVKLSNFVMAHKDTFVQILKDREQTTTLTNLRVINMAAILISYLASSNRALIENVLPGPGQFTIHRLMVALLAKYSNPEKWISKVVPVTDEEAQKDSSIGLYSSADGKSLFKQEALGIAQDICKHVLVYCRGVTEASKSPHIFTLDTYKDPSSVSSPPSLLNMTAYAKRIGNELVLAIDQHATFTSRYADVNKLPIEDINEIVSTLDIPTEDLSTFQRQQCAAKELLRLSARSLKDALSDLFILEHVLLLIWRHLESFSKFGTAEGFEEMQGWSSNSEQLQTFRMDTLAALNPTLGRVANLEFPSQMVGSDSSGLQFLKMLLRRLRMIDSSIER